MRFHDLRHGTASLLFAEGVQLEVISKLLGHSSSATTRAIYLHLLPDAGRDGAGRLDALFAAEA